MYLIIQLSVNFVHETAKHLLCIPNVTSTSILFSADQAPILHHMQSAKGAERAVIQALSLRLPSVGWMR